ncbi:hypothetical protein, partial [Streptomyces sp. Act143]|uniref:hypothetical protein n=1 Tax=Streptomyces sp. Act143 TaxID=2200760 RepID=UPI001C62FA68
MRYASQPFRLNINDPPGEEDVSLPALLRDMNIATILLLTSSGGGPAMRSLGDHFYTTSAAERANAVSSLGYVDEGIACWTPSAATGIDHTALFRMFSPASGDHFYTTDVGERD